MALTLSAAELTGLSACSETLLRPFDYPSLDAWRGAVLDTFSRLIGAEASFFNLRAAPDGERIAFSREFSRPVLDHYEVLSTMDAGYQRALDARLIAVNQTLIVAGDWHGYYEDPSVAGFYVPNQLRDSLGLLLEEPLSGLAASIELHVSHYGTHRFGRRGLAIMQQLLPSFRAGIRTMSLCQAARGRLIGVLDATRSALLLFTDGRCVHQTARVDSVLSNDAERALVLSSISRLLTEASRGGLGLSRGPGARPCTVDVRTQTAAYHIEATPVSEASLIGFHLLVSLERLTPLPIEDDILRSRYHLSPREISVARQIAEGKATADISRLLGVSIHTIRRHSERIFSKLGVHTRGAVAAALRN